MASLCVPLGSYVQTVETVFRIGLCKLKGRKLPLLGVLVISGCVAPTDYRVQLEQYVGREETQLIEAFGIPHYVTESNVVRFLEYHPRQAMSLPSGRTRNLAIRCDATFEVRERKVVGVKVGTKCVS